MRRSRSGFSRNFFHIHCGPGRSSFCIRLPGGFSWFALRFLCLRRRFAHASRPVNGLFSRRRGLSACALCILSTGSVYSHIRSFVKPRSPVRLFCSGLSSPGGSEGVGFLRSFRGRRGWRNSSYRSRCERGAPGSFSILRLGRVPHPVLCLTARPADAGRRAKTVAGRVGVGPRAAPRASGRGMNGSFRPCAFLFFIIYTSIRIRLIVIQSHILSDFCFQDDLHHIYALCRICCPGYQPGTRAYNF